MRRIILRMIAAGSLSAFSTAISTGTGVRAPGGPVQPVRTPSTSAPAQPLTLQQTDAAKPGALPPSRTLPRGSLLDLSV